MDINQIPDDLFDKIEIDFKQQFKILLNRNKGENPIFEVKLEALKGITAKYNFTFEKAQEIIQEIQLRNLDKDIGIE